MNIVSSDALREGFLLPIAETRFKVWSRKIGEHMTTYRINTIDRDGRFSGTKAVECVDDEEAVAKGQAAEPICSISRYSARWQCGPRLRFSAGRIWEI